MAKAQFKWQLGFKDASGFRWLDCVGPLGASAWFLFWSCGWRAKGLDFKCVTVQVIGDQIS